MCLMEMKLLADFLVEVDWAPAYELITSLETYLELSHHKLLELEAGWRKRVEAGLTASFADRLNGLERRPAWRHTSLLVWQCPTDRRDPAGFLTWLGSLGPGELYDRLAPFDPQGLPPELNAWRDLAVELLSGWDEQYFRTVPAAVLSGLAANAAEMAERRADMSGPELVELATGGIWLEPEPGLERALLVPQHHFRPWTIPPHSLKGTWLFGYPADVLPPAPGEPGPRLLRLTRALADENRLRILRFLAGGTRTFTEVLQFSGLSKGTVHHHLVALRAAGLVRFHGAFSHTGRYSLRPGALAGVSETLQAFIEE